MSSNLHLSKQFDQDLEHIKSQVLFMGEMIEDQLDKALVALQEDNSELADVIIANDEQVNHLQIELDKACTELIVRRQPVATDLRLVIATMRLITDVERIGDEIVKIARSVKEINKNSFLSSNRYAPIHTIAKVAQKMLRQALDAFVQLDQVKAIQMIALDEELDSDFHEMVRSLITYMMEEPKTITTSLNMLWIAKALERVGDHATNIGEGVIYIIEGDDIRHEHRSLL